MRFAFLAILAIPAFPVAAAAQTAAPAEHADHAAMPMNAASPVDHAAHAAMGAVDHTAHLMHMTGALGPYSMTRDASGTAWQPESTPMEAIHGQLGQWGTMLHGFINLSAADAGGPRGDSKIFSQSMFMAMAHRPLGMGSLTVRGMFSSIPRWARTAIRFSSRPARPRTG